MAGPLRLSDDGDHVLLERLKGGGWASDEYELIARLDVLQAANLCADLESWLVGGVSTTVDVRGRFL